MNWARRPPAGRPATDCRSSDTELVHAHSNKFDKIVLQNICED